MAIDDTAKSDVNSGRVDMGKPGGLRRFGISLVGEIPWGTHLCQFYETREDLIDILVPYFTQGLKSNEFCMWVTSLPLEVEDAKRALREAVPDLDKYLEKGQIEILSYSDWYLLHGAFNSDRVLQGWVQKEKDALNRGFDGLRLTGNTFWIERNGWKSFTDYEAAVNDVIPLHRMIALCTYSLERCIGSDVVDVIRNHVGTLIKRGNEWCMVEDVEQRREAEEMYKATVETSKDGFWVTDSEGRFLNVNDAYCSLLGYSRDELLKMRIQDVEANETAEETLQHIGKIRLQGYDHFETRHRRKDGRIINIEVSTNFLDHKGGRFFVFLHDVTARKQSEEVIRETQQTLRDSQNDLNRAQAVARTGSWRLNVQRNELLWSDETHRIFGIPKGTPMTYETFLSSIHPDDRKYVDQKWQAALRGEPYDIEHRIVVDGEVKWVREKAELETDEHGSLLGGFGTVQDINERKKAEEILRETRDYLDNLLNYASAPIIVWDKDFKITRFNHAFEHLASYKAEEVVGKDLSILFPADSREKSLTEIQHTLEGEYWESMEIPILRKDDEIRIVLWNSANIYAQHGTTLVATIAQGIDITERKKLEERLKTAERMAVIGETAAMVGHDLRNPLQAIVGFIGLAEEQLRTIRSASAKKQEIREQLKAITQQAQYMNKIVLDLQDYARPLAPELKGTDLTDLVKEVLSTLQIPETIRVSILMPHNFPKIRADPTLIKRALTNLFRNAVDAMPDGGKLTIKASQAHGEVSVRIKDTGTGIAEKNMDKLFKPLFTTKAKGQGFGLSVCKQIIEAHGGSITVESQLGKGSTFTLKIPHNKRSQKKNMHEI